VRVRDVGEVRDRLDRAGHIAGVLAYDGACRRLGDGRLDLIGVDQPGFVRIDDHNGDPARSQSVQGTGDGVVLHAAGDHPVAGADQPEQDEVHGLRTPRLEAEVARVGDAEKRRDLASRAVYRPAGIHREPVGASAGITPVHRERVVDGLDDLGGLGPRGRAVVQVDGGALGRFRPDPHQCPPPAIIFTACSS